VNSFDNSTAYNKIFPKNQIRSAPSAGGCRTTRTRSRSTSSRCTGRDILDAYNTNYSMAGDPDQLKRRLRGHRGRPGPRHQIEECIGTTGDARTACWADADKVLMEQVVPIVPLIFSNVEQIISSRVQNYTYSLFDNQMAYDQVALAPGA
jgi:hypothetical protein